MRTRLLLGSTGLALAAYGAVLLLTRQRPSQWLEVGLWLGAGVVLHDAVLSGLVMLGCLVGARLLPRAWQAPAAVALVVWGALGLVAVPVLTRAGARADNATLLDRPYATAWWVGSVIVVVAVVVAGLTRDRAARRSRPVRRSVRRR